MDTSFFDESHFGDLLSKVKERSKLTVQQQAVKDHMERLFEVDKHISPSPSKYIHKVWIKKTDMLKNSQLVKNPQFLSDPHETWWKWLTHGVTFFTKFH